MRLPPIIAAALVAVLMLSSCSEAQVRRSEDAVAALASVVATLEARQGQAERAMEVARALASLPGAPPAAAEAVEAAAGVLREIQTALPIARQEVEDAEAAVAAARAARDAGQGTVGIIAAVIAALLGGGGTVGALAARSLGKWRAVAVTAAQLAQQFKPAAEKADADGAARAIAAAHAKQVAAGAAGLADVVRHGGLS